MYKLFENAIFGNIWNEERCKFGYSNQMEDRLNDALYNIVIVLKKCRKCQDVQLNQEQLAAFRTKVGNFSGTTKNQSKKSLKIAHQL